MFQTEMKREKMKWKQGRSDGGYIGIYTPPPKSVYPNFFMWLFCLLAMTS